MAFEIEDLVDNMHGAFKFFLAHLNGLQDDQWDWQPSPACRSIRAILLHLCETYGEKADLETELVRPIPDVTRVQALFEDAPKRNYEKLRIKYADAALDAALAVIEP